MQVPITLLIGTSIITAKSLAVTNSVSFRVFSSSASSSAASRSRSRKSSRFSLRHLAAFLGALVVRRASVSFTCFCTSSSLTSGFSGRFDLLRFFFEALSPAASAAFLALFFGELLGIWLALFSMSIFSFPMRLRFLRSVAFPPSLLRASWRALSLSRRSLRFSSFDFFFGRVCWLMAERSILPTTLSDVFSVGVWSVKISLSSFFSGVIAGSAGVGLGSSFFSGEVAGVAVATGCLGA